MIKFYIFLKQNNSNVDFVLFAYVNAVNKYNHLALDMKIF